MCGSAHPIFYSTLSLTTAQLNEAFLLVFWFHLARSTTNMCVFPLYALPPLATSVCEDRYL